jgi:hypothetical protein
MSRGLRTWRRTRLAWTGRENAWPRDESHVHKTVHCAGVYPGGKGYGGHLIRGPSILCIAAAVVPLHTQAPAPTYSGKGAYIDRISFFSVPCAPRMMMQNIVR